MSRSSVMGVDRDIIGRYITGQSSVGSEDNLQILVFLETAVSIPINHYLSTKDFWPKHKFEEMLSKDFYNNKVRSGFNFKQFFLLYSVPRVYLKTLTEFCLNSGNVTLKNSFGAEYNKDGSFQNHNVTREYTLWGILYKLLGDVTKNNRLERNGDVLRNVLSQKTCIWFISVVDIGKKQVEYQAVYTEQIVIFDLLRVRFVKELFQNTRYAGPDRQRLLLAKYRFLLGGVLIS